MCRFIITYANENDSSWTGKVSYLAYNEEHALMKFHDSLDSEGWEVVSIEKSKI